MIYNINNAGGSTGNMIIRVTVPDDKVGKTITCTLDSTVLTDTVPASLEVEFKVNDFGDWVIACDGLSKTVKTYYIGLYEVNIERPIVALVPIMTSNTTPYGTCIENGKSGSNEAYYAFNQNSSNNYLAGSGSNRYIGYTFPNPICVKQVVVGYIDDAYAHQTDISFKIQASNDGFSSDIHDLTELISYHSQTVAKVIDINNSDYYLSYRLFAPTIAHYMAVRDLQFYGYEE